MAFIYDEIQSRFVSNSGFFTNSDLIWSKGCFEKIFGGNLVGPVFQNKSIEKKIQMMSNFQSNVFIFSKGIFVSCIQKVKKTTQIKGVVKMDCFTCHLYRKSAALDSFIPHVNASHPLRLLKNNPNKPKRFHHSDANLLANHEHAIISPPIINLYIESERIPGDGINDQDFLCVVSIFGNNGWEKYARTESNFSNFSRKWIQPITVLAENKLMRFELYQIISDLYSLRHQRFIGDCEIELKDILATEKLRLPILLSYDFIRFINSPKLTQEPCLILKHRELQKNTKGSFFFKMTYTSQIRYSAISLKPSHYFEIEIVENDIIVYRSNTVKLNPKAISIFDTVEFNQQLLCGSSLFTQIRFKLHEVSKKDIVIFQVETTLDALTSVSITKYPVDNHQGFSIGQFEVTFIGANQNFRIDDLKLNGVSFQPIYAIDFSDGKKACDTFKAILCDVGDSLNLITQIRPLISFGFGNFSEKHNVFSFSKSFYYSSTKKMIQSLSDRLLKIERTSTESKMATVIDRCRRLAVEKWHELRAFTVATIITSGNFVTDYEEAINLIVDSDGLPIVFLLLTMNTSKNKFISLFHNEKSIKSSSNPNKKISRKILKVIPYGTQFMNQLTNLKNVARSVSKMIHSWANSTKNSFSTGFSTSVSFSGGYMSSSFSISSLGSKNTESDNEIDINSNITKQPSVEECIIAAGLKQSSQQMQTNQKDNEEDLKSETKKNSNENIPLGSFSNSNDEADDEYNNSDLSQSQPNEESVAKDENNMNEITKTEFEQNQTNNEETISKHENNMNEITKTELDENNQANNAVLTNEETNTASAANVKADNVVADNVETYSANKTENNTQETENFELSKNNNEATITEVTKNELNNSEINHANIEDDNKDEKVEPNNESK